SDLLQRGFDGNAHDVCTGCLVAFELQLGECDGTGLDEGHAATGDDAFLDCCLGVAHSVFDAVLALLELNLGCGTGLDDCNAAGQLGQALLQLLAVVVRIGVLDLGANLVHATGDLLGVARTLDDGGLVLGDNNLAGGAQQVDGGVFELQADFLGDDLATGEDGNVGQHGLAAVAEARCLDGDGLEQAADLVHDQGCKGFALDVLGDDQQRLVRLHDLLKDRNHVLDIGDLRVGNQDVRIFKDRFLALVVGDEVGRD